MTREERVHKLADTQHSGGPRAVASIPVTDLKMGDHVIWGGQPFLVEAIKRDGPIVRAEVTHPRDISIDYLAIERVDVLHPRPHEGKAQE